MSRTFRPWSPTQSYLLPPSPAEWLPEGHLVFFLLDLMPDLDLSAIDKKYRDKDPRGNVGFDPHMMVALLLLGYSKGIASSRRLERATYEDVAFRVLTAGEHPDHTRISEFRRLHLKELQSLFIQILRLCQKAGLVKLGHVALDGTKIKANASKHKAMSYDRMLKTEKELEAEIQDWLKKSEQVDQSEDAQFGKDRRGDELPDELQRRKDRLEKIRKARAELEAEAAAARARELAEKCKTAAAAAKADPESEKAKAAAGKADEKAKAAKNKADERAKKIDRDPPDVAPRDPGSLPSHQVKSTPDGDPAPDAQRNFTDPESRIMKSGSDFVQAYNCQAAVDEAHQIIVAESVTNQAPDCEHLRPLVDQMIDNCDGALPWRFTADAGYFSDSNVGHCQHKNVDAYIATGRLKHGEDPSPICGRIPNDITTKGRMARKLRTEKGKKAYARRKATVEPVFGQIKEARGFRRFLLRGLEKARGEWALICATHNLLKLFNAGNAAVAA